MFVENWPQQEKSLQKNTAKITEASEEQVFFSTYLEASINLCLLWIVLLKVESATNK